jgi:hypothetical protein
MAIIYGFGRAYRDDWPIRTRRELKEDLERIEKELRVGRGAEPPSMMAILNGNQKQHFHKIMLENGFEIIKEGIFNTNHGSRLNIYVKELFPNVQKPRKTKSVPASGETLQTASGSASKGAAQRSRTAS